MAKKFKTTPFARFFIMLLVLTPLAYIGASYYNGEDPVQNIKQTIGIEESSSNNQKTTKGKSEVERLRDENARLKRKLKAKEEEIKKLKNN